MRITVNVEIAPEEVPMATELLAVLRQLTDHVSVQHADGSAAASRGPSAAASAPGGTAATSPEPMPHATSAPQLQPAPPPAPPSAGSGPLTPASSAGGAVPAPAVAAIAFPPGTTPQQQIQQLIAQSEFTEHPEPLARQLEAIITDPALGGPPVMFPQFVEVWTKIALDPQLPAQERSAVPFVLLLQHLSQSFRDKFRDRVMRELLKHLAVVRPNNANRSEYYIHAEVFAALVSIEIVPVDGAVKTMVALAKADGKRGAAVTMLGKTVELAGHLIAEKAGQAMQDMQTCVATITDPEFHYDVEYINSTMGWGGAVAAGGGAAARQLQLVPAHSIADSHTDTVFALALDPAHSQFVSGGKDTYLQVWSQAGHPIQKIDLGDVYTSSMDFHPRLNMLLCTCINPGNQKLRLAAFMSSQPQGFGSKGTNTRDDMVAVASVRALADTNGFLTGETVVVDNQPKPVVRFWDLASAPSFQALQPTATYFGHAQIPTCLRGVFGDANMFLSGDKSGAMLLWDRRSPSHVGAFAAEGKPTAHSAMVTGIESTGPLVVSGSTDKTVAIWDLRSLGRPPVGSVTADNMTVLKLALNQGRQAVAVSAVQSLSLLDIANPAAPVLSPPVVAAWPDGRRRSTYHDIKWHEAAGLLYAAGKDKVVDMYTLP